MMKSVVKETCALEELNELQAVQPELEGAYSSLSTGGHQLVPVLLSPLQCRLQVVGQNLQDRHAVDEMRLE